MPIATLSPALTPTEAPNRNTLPILTAVLNRSPATTLLEVLSQRPSTIHPVVRSPSIIPQQFAIGK